MNLHRLLSYALLLCLVSGPGWAAEGTVSLNMREADIRDVVASVADATGRNFLIDPRVQGKVTIISPQGLEPDELYEVFQSILQVHGFAAVETGAVVKIVPDASAKQLGGPTMLLEPGELEPDALVTRVVVLQYVKAAQLVPVLRPLVPQNGHLAGYDDANALIVTDRESNIERLIQIIQRIDRPTSDEVELIRLDNANAAEVVAVISKLQATQARPGATPGPVMAADERSNSILVSGDPAARVRIRGLVAHLDIPLERSGDTNVIFLKYAQATDLATLLQGRFSSDKNEVQGAGVDEVKVDIQADTFNNALIVTASLRDFQNIQNVVRQLDIRRAQVLVEAVIAEVSTDLSSELGVQFVAGDVSGNTSPLLATSLGSNSLPNTLLAIGSGAASSVTVPAGLTAGIGEFRENGFSWGVLLSALAGDAATNILSTPSLLATDNEEAEIVVGQNVPFITGQYTTSSGTSGVTSTVSNPFQTIERQDVGITLQVKPQINEGSSVRLEIKQEVSSIANSSVSASDLVTNKRSITTVITVEDGQIIVLGGLIEDVYRDTEQKVPVLGDIPVLGQLFRYNQTNKTKQNLMVFLRPVIVRDTELANRYSGQKYSYLRARQLEAQLGNRHSNLGDLANLPLTLEGLFQPVTNEVPDPQALQPVPKPTAAEPESETDLWSEGTPP